MVVRDHDEIDRRQPGALEARRWRAADPDPVTVRQLDEAIGRAERAELADGVKVS